MRTRAERTTRRVANVAALVAAVLLGLRCGEPGAVHEQLGFTAGHRLPRPEAGYDFGTGPFTRRWEGGPRDGLEHLDPRELAEASLVWFERDRQVAEWHSVDCAETWLQLDYTSGDGRVSVSCEADAGASWPDRLHAWFASYPPSDAGPRAPDAEYSWTVLHADGRVDGRANTAADARATVERLLARSELPVDLVRLGRMTRNTEREMDCWSVETSDVRELGALQALLEERGRELGLPRGLGARPAESSGDS